MTRKIPTPARRTVSFSLLHLAELIATAQIFYSGSRVPYGLVYNRPFTCSVCKHACDSLNLYSPPHEGPTYQVCTDCTNFLAEHLETLVYRSFHP